MRIASSTLVVLQEATGCLDQREAGATGQDLP
jgi:hypothetical protein